MTNLAWLNGINKKKFDVAKNLLFCLLVISIGK